MPGNEYTICGKLDKLLNYVYRSHPIVPSIDQLASMIPIIFY